MEINKKICSDTVITRKTGLDFTDIDGDVVMMDLNKGRYYSFNSIGSRIWQLIAEPFSVKEMISLLTTEFDVDYKTCEENVLDFLNKVYNEELISIA